MCTFSENETGYFDIAIAIIYMYLEESVRCVICSSSATTQKSLRLNPYAVLINDLIFILF